MRKLIEFGYAFAGPICRRGLRVTEVSEKSLQSTTGQERGVDTDHLSSAGPDAENQRLTSAPA
jgi:hypothetical protein